MPSAEYFAQFFDYRDGFLFWKTPRKNVRVGAVAGSVDAKGYVRIMLERKVYLAHRIVYALHHENVPNFVDHRDGNPLNNRVENLRACTQAENAQNRKRQVNNTSGVKGVYWNRAKNKWMARVMADGQREFLGYFEHLPDASKAVMAARIRAHADFSRNH